MEASASMCPESGGSLDKSRRFVGEAELVSHASLQKKGGACPTVVLFIGALVGSLGEQVEIFI